MLGEIGRGALILLFAYKFLFQRWPYLCFLFCMAGYWPGWIWWSAW